MNRSHEYAGILIARARDDRVMMGTLMNAPDSPDWGVGFHAQQAVEKAIKAVLSDRGVEYPRTHDLAGLAGLVRGEGVPGPPDEADLDLLTPYGAPLRYEPDAHPRSENALDRTWAAGVVQRTLAWAENLLRRPGENRGGHLPR
jgi:HEPN domain-containing protein